MTAPSPTTAIVHRLHEQTQRHYVPLSQKETPYRDSVCELCERTVSIVLQVPVEALRKKTRSRADVAFARQVAMYLCHTTFSLLLTEVGLHFRRDRTTVAHACALIENKREEPDFDTLICQLEALLFEARAAMSHCYSMGASGQDLSEIFPGALK